MTFYRVSVTKPKGKYTATEYVTAAAFDENEKVLMVNMVDVSGGGHGYPLPRARALRDYLSGPGRDVSIDEVEV